MFQPPDNNKRYIPLYCGGDNRPTRRGMIENENGEERMGEHG